MAVIDQKAPAFDGDRAGRTAHSDAALASQLRTAAVDLRGGANYNNSGSSNDQCGKRHRCCDAGDALFDTDHPTPVFTRGCSIVGGIPLSILQRNPDFDAVRHTAPPPRAAVQMNMDARLRELPAGVVPARLRRFIIV